MDDRGFYESTEEQISDEFHNIYKRMTDPEERKKHGLKMRRETFVQELNDDTGL